MGDCGALGSGVGASAGVEADGGGWGEPKEVRGAAVEGAGRGRRGSEWRRGERSRHRRLRESPPF